MDHADNRYLARHRNVNLLRRNLTPDAEYYRDECASLAGKVALLTRENTALRARVAPLEARVHALEMELSNIFKR
jgi:predicted RNase H-like nuclease (RuvC/YqgF family)